MAKTSLWLKWHFMAETSFSKMRNPFKIFNIIRLSYSLQLLWPLPILLNRINLVRKLLVL